MRLNQPKKWVWFVSIIVGVVGIIASFLNIPVVSEYSIWLVVIGWLLLILSTVLKGF